MSNTETAKKISPLLYSIFILLLFVPLFYLHGLYRLFIIPKYLLLSLGLLTFSIFTIAYKIEIVPIKPLLFQIFVFFPFFIRWIFTPFPVFSLHFTLFFLFYNLFLFLLFSVDKKVYINKNFLIWMWIIVSGIYAILLNFYFLKVPIGYTLLKRLDLLRFGMGMLGGNQNYSAEFLAFSFVSLMIIFFYKREDFNFRIVTSTIVDIILKLLVLLNIFVSIIFLSTRASLASLLVCVFFFILFMIRRNKAWLFVFFLVFILIVAVLSIPSLRSHLPYKVRSVTNIEKLKHDIRLRIFHWTVSWYMGLESPIWGKGPGMFRVELPDVSVKLKERIGLRLKGNLFDNRGVPLFPTNSHNDPLEFWAEGGILLFIYFMLFFYVYWILLGNLSFWDKIIAEIPIFGLYLNSLFAFPFHLPFVFSFIGFYIFIMASADTPADRFTFSFVKVKGLSLYIKYFIFISALIFFFVTVRFFIADSYLYYGKRTESLSFLRISSKLNPVNPYVWKYLYNFSIKQKRPIDERIYYSSSFFKIVDSPKYREHLAFLWEKKGNYKEAIKNLERALKLYDKSPNAYIWYHKLAYYYYHMGDIQRAIKNEKQSLEMKSNKNINLKIEGYANLSIFYYKLGKYKEALNAAERVKNLLESLPLDKPEYKKFKDKYTEIIAFIEKLKKKL